jgi:tripartite ATP-independent transporter DctM subunit
MTALMIATVGLTLLFLGAGIPVAAAMGLLGLVLGLAFADRPMWHVLGQITWNPSTDFVFVALPLFILLGEIFLRSGQTSYMYMAIAHWLNRLPGGLLHTNIVACALFGAPCGSSVATAATVGTVALPTFQKRGYDDRIVAGSLAAGGTLGILLPPSVNMIIYGVLTDTSIGRMYLGGWIPGILLSLMFMVLIGVRCKLRPNLAPIEARVSWHTRLVSLPHLLPVIIILLVIMLSIELGFATPTESAALGVVATLVLSLFYKRVSFQMLRASAEATMRTTAMVMLIIMAAYFLNFVITYLGVPRAAVSWVTGLGMSPTVTMIGIIILYLILGLFLETISMMITTLPVVFPVVKALGYDPVWFGIVLIILIEAALISPPVGMNFYVIQGIRRTGRIEDVIIGCVPFLITMIVAIALLMLFPALVTWLPDLVMGGGRS